MKCTRSILVLVVATVTMVAEQATAQVPQTVTFSARLVDDGEAVVGDHAFTFRIYDAETGGTLRWTETHASMPVVDGLVTVGLGSQSPLTISSLQGAALWVEVEVDGEVMSPRLALRSVPYSIRAGDASLLDGRTSGSFASAVHDHDPAYVNAAGDTMTGTLDLGADLALSGKHALMGTDSWLRLNQTGAFTSGIHSPHNLNVSGLTLGALYFDPGVGNLDMTGFGWMRAGGRLNGIAVGAAPFGALDYPYETIQLDPAYNLRFAFGSAERMRLHADGRLWMSSNRGDCPSGWFCNGMFWDLSVSSILYSGLNQRSDRRLKQDIAPIDDGLATVRRLRPVTFAWRDASVPGPQYGYVAQEVREVLPALVSETPDGMLALDAAAMVPILMQAVQELDRRNTAMRAELDATRQGGDGGWPGWRTTLIVALIGVIVLRRRR